MKSLHVNLARGWRGGERQTLLLMLSLLELGDEAELVARRGESLATRAEAAGIPVRHGPAAIFRIGRQGFDVLHAHEAKGLNWAALARAVGQPPLVATRRVDNIPGQGWLTHFKYRQADTIVTVSEHVRAIMTAWGAAPAKLRVIPDAVPAASEPDPVRLAAVSAPMAGKHVIGFVGALVNKHKDPLTLVRAFDRLRRRDRDLALLIVGEGPDRHTLEEYVKTHDVPDVHMTGFVEDPELYYACMDVFVLPSRMEGLGTAALDAFAAGVPVVAGRAGALPEIVRDGETGLLFEPGNDAELAACLSRLFRRPEERRSIVRAALELVRKRHTTQQMARAYRRLYSQLVD